MGQWCPNIKYWVGTFVIFQGIWTIIAKKPNSFVIHQMVLESKKGGKDQESIQSSTTRDPGYQMWKCQKHN